MFDIWRQVKLKQARNALRDGRLDEAFSIAIQKDVRDHRGGQALLEKILDPLLARAEEHRKAGRLREALIDVERAIEAGGQQPRALDLRQEIATMMRSQKEDAARVNRLLESARQHLAQGSIHASEKRLEALPVDRPEASRLRRAVADRDRKGRLALERARRCLEAGDTVFALEAAREARSLLGSHEEISRLIPEVVQATVSHLDRALDEGELRLARDLHAELQSLVGNSLVSRRVEEDLRLVSRATEALRSGDHAGARVYLGRFSRARPSATWASDAATELDTVEECLRRLRTGPLGVLQSSVGQLQPATDLLQEESVVPTMTLAPERPELPASPGATADDRRRRSLLWVDGIGSFMLLPQSTLTIGRHGSTTKPDLALPANLSGYHAEIQRVDGDYFLLSVQGEVRVNGKKIQRKLLADGDVIELAPRCQLAFRLPTGMSSTAILKLKKGLRLEGDVREVILFDGLLLLGGRPHCHIRTRGQQRPVVLLERSGELICRAEEDVEVDGQAAERETRVPAGAHVRVGELTFTITGATGGDV